jgi:hypothetical protein
MTRSQYSIATFVALVLLVVSYLFWGGVYAGGPATKLSVVFVGMTNSPTRQMTPTRLEVGSSATGPCAMFWVTNIATKQFIWFKTVSIEQKTDAGWQTFVPSGGSWYGVEGFRWDPGYGCLFAVGWPPGLATNATWRLQVLYGRDVSTFRVILNHEMGRRIFTSGKGELTVPSSEVKQ